MRKLGFWSRGEHEQIAAINEASSELAALQWGAGELRQQVVGLQRTVQAQQHKIDRLQSALQAVCDLLVDLDLIDETALEYRIDAAMADGAAAAAPSAFDPPAPRSTVRAEAECAHCRRQVPSQEISFTDRGPMCDACVAALGAALADG